MNRLNSQPTPDRAPSPARRVAVPVVAVAAATFAALLLHRVAPDRPVSFACYFAAVAASAGYGGLWPGVLATVLAVLSFDFLLLPPFYTLTVQRSDLPLVALFLIVALGINALSESLHASVRASDQALSEARDGLDALNAITSGMATSLELAVVLEQLGSGVRSRLGVEGGFVALDVPGTPNMEIVSAWGLTESQQAALHLANPECGLRGDLFRGARDDGDWTDFQFVPLVAHGETHGWLGMRLGPRIRGDKRLFLETLGREAGAIVQNARLFEEVRQGQERMRRLSARLVTVQEQERRTIARELHDEIGQLLTGIKLNLEAGMRAGGVPAHSERALACLKELMAHVDDLSLTLRPAILDDLGLVPALAWRLERYTASTQIQVRFEHAGVDRRFPQEVETAAYRIVQEALTNVARHSDAHDCAVRLWFSHDLLCVQVTDAGVGFYPERIGADSTGIAGMEERAALAGGRLIVESRPGEGSRLTAELPVCLDATSRSSTEVELQ